MKSAGKLAIATILAAAVAIAIPFLRAAPTYFDIKRKAEHEPTIRAPLPLIAHCVLAAEDSDFMNRSAWESIYRSFSPLFTHKLAPGASLTSQLTHGARTPDAPTDPFTQIALYILLEATMSREQVLSQYLWGVYLGQHNAKPVYGVENAAASFYNKTYRDLTLSEAALMAATIKSPALFSPKSHPERARERRNQVLDRLYKAEIVSKAQLEEAVHEALPNNA